MPPLESEEIAALARTVGLALPPERVEPVARQLDQLMRLAAELRELPLDGAEPVLGPPRWPS
jgi:Asp-tRNA(Asn)/Glu-tRNA(Gln) amidotransferase C subunit